MKKVVKKGEADVKKRTRTIIATISLCICMLLLTGCAATKTAKELGALRAFRYSFGSFFGGSYVYSIAAETDDDGNERVMLRSETENIAQPEKTSCVVDASVLDELAALIFDNGIAGWDGFSERDSSILDGYGFVLNAQFENGTITADGYMKEPRGYEKAHAALADYLAKLADGAQANNHGTE